MKEHNCQIVSRETLVAYSDGDLSPSEAEQIAEHIATCPECQAATEALDRSLQVTQAIWQTGEAQWPKIHSFDRIKSNRRSFNKVVAVAASILLVLGIGAIWQLLSEPSQRARMIGEEPTAAEIEMAANRAALAAQMLAVADLFATQPGGEEYAAKRYTYVIDSFPGREECEQARLRLKTLTERRVE